MTCPVIFFITYFTVRTIYHRIVPGNKVLYFDNFGNGCICPDSSVGRAFDC